jgi:hypothetical protein
VYNYHGCKGCKDRGSMFIFVYLASLALDQADLAARCIVWCAAAAAALACSVGSDKINERKKQPPYLSTSGVEVKSKGRHSERPLTPIRVHGPLIESE